MLEEYPIFSKIPNLRPATVPIHYTMEQMEEWVKCHNSFEYFVENYIYIKNSDSQGMSLFKLRDYQRRLLHTIHDNKLIIVLFPRQSGKSTTVAAYIVWKLLFNDKFNILIAADKSSSAIDIMTRIKDAYSMLPYWIQVGVTAWNAYSIQLENRSGVVASSTTKKTGRGGTYDLVLSDEFAFIDTNIANDFFASIFPTISSGKANKFIIVSTANGMNHYYKMWEEAKSKINDFVPIEIKWNEVPGRDEAYKNKTIGVLGLARWTQEYESIFLGGENTLVSPSHLANLVIKKPIEISGKCRIFERPITNIETPSENGTYLITVDTAHGKGQDSSAFIVFNISKAPYTIAAIFQDNTINELVYPSVVHQYAKLYNNANILVETNDLGKQVANILYHDYEYENVLMTETNGRAGQIISFKSKAGLGLRMTSSVKKVGCSVLKSLIETNKLIVQDLEFISELSNFVAKGGSYAASSGNHDDIVMCGVMFGWFVNQPFFQDEMDISLRQLLFKQKIEEIEGDSVTFGIIDDNLGFKDIDRDMADQGYYTDEEYEDIIERYQDASGWQPVQRKFY